MKIVAVALRDRTGKVHTLPSPNRHHNVINMMYAEGLRGKDFHEQGFLTSDGTYVDRREARKIADAANQCIPERDYEMAELFSEDVW